MVQIFCLLFAVLVVLKLVGIIHIGWLAVSLALLPAVLILGFIALCFVLALIGELAK